ncbi:MAG: hypothetical protein ACR2H4_03325 [Pyrinomonadaceae bacterium]
MENNELTTDDNAKRADKLPKPGPEPGPDVKITINGASKAVRRGRHTVVEIKKLGEVPLADELEQLVDGKLKPLPDDGAVTIKGGEVFMSHARSGGSS